MKRLIVDARYTSTQLIIDSTTKAETIDMYFVKGPYLDAMKGIPIGVAFHRATDSS
jgi:hypothetical protein